MASPSPSSATYEVGEAVWVVTAPAEEGDAAAADELEPGLVLRTGCTHNFDGSGDGDGSVPSPDGVLVQLGVSRIRAIYPPSRLRRVVRAAAKKDEADRETPEAPRRTLRNRKVVGDAAPSSSAATRTAQSLPPAPPTMSSRHGSARLRSIVTPSPTTASSSTTSSSSHSKNSTTTVEPRNTNNQRKRSAANSQPKLSSDSRAAAKVTAKKPSDAPASPARKKSKVVVAPKAAPVAESSSSSSSSGSDSDDNTNNNSDNPDDDKPFTIEAAPSGRATCRRCDQVISKGDLRLSHVPLFRGKPGYRVYRHLPCAVFPDEITTAEDVGGWSRLSPDALDRLRSRIAESREELALENQEIQPDELVPLAFEGPLRSTPPGLTASLLPFQVEGASWMHQQEQTDVAGGILADEMGMVRPRLVVRWEESGRSGSYDFAHSFTRTHRGRRSRRL